MKNYFTKGGVLETMPVDDILGRQRYALFRMFSLTGTILLALFAISEGALSQLNPMRMLIYTCIGAFLLINFVALRFHKNLTIAYTISIIAGLTLIHCATYYNGGVRNPDFFYLGSITLY